jgi:hypothetical protein
MDAAQWSDWLDAVIRVSPDFDAVKEARRKIQMQYEKGLQILKIASPGERNVQLKELGKEKAISGWHLVGDHSISASLAYRAMQAFLMEYWERGHRQSQDIEAVLNDLDTGPDVNGGCWSEWLNAIRNNKQ